jgi:hypothetical protein
MTRGANKQPSGKALFLFKHGMKAILIPTGGAKLKFIIHLHFNDFIIHRTLLLG